MAISTEKIPAPEFPTGVDWLNTEHPLQLRELRGKIVLLDFWTYCCINCMHVLPELKRLERKYARELVVVGVHSAKFIEERETENIRQAILRYDIEHPVINDRHMLLWRLYRIRAWPTLVLIDPEGNIVGQLSGEDVYPVFDEAITQLIDEYNARHILDRTPLAVKLEREHTAPALLSYPGKVAADAATQQLAIADTNHHRILIVSPTDGRVLSVIGSGEVGLADGNFATARFSHPQGVTVAGEMLYVADTENHAIRQVDLRKHTVTTLAGTGEQAREPNVSGPGRQTRLNSPWDVIVVGETLYVAMAGSHQIWQLDLHTQYVQPYAGTGREARVDGPRLQAAFAQPSGLATDGRRLYVADSEASAIRAVELPPGESVTTLAGGDLFDFGDRDGLGTTARFQHPLGITYADGMLYLADTYNHKIKRLTLATGAVETVVDARASVRLNEPAGLSLLGTTLYIADTNHHVIRAFDLNTSREETLVLAEPSVIEVASEMPPFFGEIIMLPQQTIGSGTVTLTASLTLPPGHTLNTEAPNELRLRIEGTVVDPEAPTALRLARPVFPAQISLSLHPGEGTIAVEYDVYYCGEKASAVCLFREARLLLPVRGDMTFSGHALRVSFDIAKA